VQRLVKAAAISRRSWQRLTMRTRLPLPQKVGSRVNKTNQLSSLSFGNQIADDKRDHNLEHSGVVASDPSSPRGRGRAWFYSSRFNATFKPS